MAKYAGYVERNKEDVEARANQTGGMYDNPIKNGIQTWKPAEGENTVRILPPTWEDAKHYGYDIWTHGNVGTDKNQYLCHEKMKYGAEPFCPVCEELRRLGNSVTADEAKELKPRHNIICWIVDRKTEKEGPKVWSLGWMRDKDIADLSIGKDGEVLPIDHPDDGYDVSFRRTGQGLRTRYSATSIDRKPSYLSAQKKQQEAWLDIVSETPLPDCLQFYSVDHIERVFAGKSTEKEADEAAPRERLRDQPERARTREPESEPARERVREPADARSVADRNRELEGGGERARAPAEPEPWGVDARGRSIPPHDPETGEVPWEDQPPARGERTRPEPEPAEPGRRERVAEAPAEPAGRRTAPRREQAPETAEPAPRARERLAEAAPERADIDEVRNRLAGRLANRSR